ncbi:MAG: DUF3365 domain-containing protein [Pseudomonadota bacterium]|nr:DUF3365 domain-containing protein [Pseudomonadota bacterium]
MKKLILSLTIAYSIAGVAEELITEDKLQTYRNAAQAFMQALKAELQTAMKSDGPVKAIAVCKDKAPEIAEQKSTEYGFELSRTSLKPRNPKNAPDSWETEVMKSFQQQKADGADPMKLEHAEVVTTPEGKQVIRYMKAIPTAELCLTCHGSDIAPEIQAKLKELYPQDQAVGFEVGDLRGAFSFTEAVTQKSE